MTKLIEGIQDTDGSDYQVLKKILLDYGYGEETDDFVKDLSVQIGRTTSVIEHSITLLLTRNPDCLIMNIFPIADKFNTDDVLEGGTPADLIMNCANDSRPPITKDASAPWSGGLQLWPSGTMKFFYTCPNQPELDLTVSDIIEQIRVTCEANNQ